MAGTLTVDTIQSDSSYASTLNVASKMNFASGMQIGGQDTTFGGMRNRIINGNMSIAQRGTTTLSIDNSGWQRPVDKTECYFSATGSKFTAQQNAGAVTPPVGFTNYVGITSTSAYTVGAGEWSAVRQIIEGFNVADLRWGTANAQPITLSFWVRSSLTGTHGGAIYNGDGSRSYPFTYTINAANTWEYETITIPGDTSGTWNSTNGPSITPSFSMGTGATLSGPAGAWAGTFYASATGAVSVVGTNAATWYMTGLQVEKGSAASAFEYRQYGQELALCQRYCYQLSYNGTIILCPGTQNSSVDARGMLTFPVTMRANPTGSAPTGSNYYGYDKPGAGIINFNSMQFAYNSPNGCLLYASVSAGTIGYGIVLYLTASGSYVRFDSEL